MSLDVPEILGRNNSAAASMPDREITPDSCRHCGIEQRDHFQRWVRDVGWHSWIAPTDAQRLARMLARRATRRSVVSEWLVLDMDDGVLRREPTRRAAVAWARQHFAGEVLARRQYGRGGAYEYFIGGRGEESGANVFVERYDVAKRNGWDVDQQPLFPLADPNEQVDRPSAAVAAQTVVPERDATDLSPQVADDVLCLLQWMTGLPAASGEGWTAAEARDAALRLATPAAAASGQDIDLDWLRTHWPASDWPCDELELLTDEEDEHV